jgi:hypothetical protein
MGRSNYRCCPEVGLGDDVMFTEAVARHDQALT